MFGKTTGLVVLGLGAYAYYKYSQMSPEQKEKVVDNLKAKGQKLYDDYMPQEIKNMFDEQGKAQTTGEASAAANDMAV